MKTTLEGVARKPSETDDGDWHLKLEDIIVPMELPPASMRALRFAGRLAEQFGSRVHLLHVEEPAILLNDFESQVVIAKSADEVAGEMKEDLTRIAQRELPSRVSADAIVRSGRLAQEIISAAKELHSHLIILATRRRSILARALLGSTADAVAHHAPCPVLLIRCEETPGVEPALRHNEGTAQVLPSVPAM